jgi:DNA repair protein RadC
MAEQKSERHRTETDVSETFYKIDPSEWRVNDMPMRIRPREETERLGIENVSDDVLLALILRAGVKGCNVVDLARGLLKRYGSLTSMASASTGELARFKGIGPVKAQILKAALELGVRLNSEALPQNPAIKNPGDVAKVLADRVRTLDVEVFWVLLLDTKNRLIGRPVEATSGILNSSLVHPREIFREAIRTACGAVVLAHNHPSGDPAPSREDLNITKQLVDAGKIVDIKVLDHVIVGGLDDSGELRYLSLRESGMADF